MSILLIGKNGQVGFELQRSLAPLGPVVALGSAECNLSQPESIRQAVRRHRPTIIVNAGAYTAVDRAETERDLAFAINGTAPGILGAEASAIGALVVHYSTDYVFDGHGTRPYRETDPTAPQSAYGRSKLEGEVQLAAATPRHLILRTSWVVGVHGTNFAKTMLRLAAERDELHVVDDQIGAPTSASLIADCTAHMIRPFLGHERQAFPSGIYHLAAGGETSWHGYARHIIARARQAGQPLRVSPDRVIPIRSTDYPTQARRPHNSRLDTTRLREAFGLTLPDWREGLDHILQQIL
ncbi:MAG: dTDP-4-dehydrorhamnose reductase [Hydrogenophaga sp.]|jgi:dTDP-4-dehydrorhamnose reductase|uniref:dTDP-4-dehydrorhamnose reductase n=2 Tax=Hydrogenophaga sp. TaxID=1904254 RepID=UPI002A3587FA|nr:dTDP-4-dehydrorhamnose reductase [Hydrogenophaga sp.]MDX9969155.1 dTDP-4-dehydrorhamnose reductase [Hydrogenophaga sp.]